MPASCSWGLINDEQTVTWDAQAQPNVQAMVDHAAQKDTMLTAYFKANTILNGAPDLFYQDFRSKFVWVESQKKWKVRQRDFAIGRLYSQVIAHIVFHYSRVIVKLYYQIVFVRSVQDHWELNYEKLTAPLVVESEQSLLSGKGVKEQIFQNSIEIILHFH